MKRLFVAVAITLMLTAASHAVPSIRFDTTVDSHPSWRIAYNGTNWQMIFDADATHVTSTEPSDPVLLKDTVRLPTMNILNIVDHPDIDPALHFLSGTLSPASDVPLTIVSDTGTPTTVFSASLGDGGVFIAGTNWFAYQLPEDDLDVTSFTSGYSSVLDRIAALDATGLPVDLGISGVADHSTSLYGLLKGTSGSATGGLVGAINVIPAPGALLLASLGAAAVGWLRTKRHL